MKDGMRLALFSALAMTLTAIGVTASLAAGRVALVIGNATYKETAQLKNTLNDAEDVSAALTRLGFDVLKGTNLDKRGMERLIRDFEKKLAGAEVALFFYAGHGLQIGGRNYLVPTDARLSTEGDVDFESLPLSLVLKRMEREARTSLVLLDACRDNPLARNLARSMGTRSANVGKGLAEVRTGVGTLIAFSTQPGNVALDGEARNSPYTGALLRNIEVPGRDMLSSLAAVRGEVVQATNGMQVPWEHTSLLGPVILKPGGGSAQPGSQAGAAASAGTDAAAAGRHWEAIKDSNSIRLLEAYVRHYQNSFYADLAQSRIDELKRKASGASAATPSAPPPPRPSVAKHQPPPANRGSCASRRSRDGGLYCVSSVLAPQFGNTYGPEHLFDGDPATAWVHGSKGTGVGSAITIVFDRARPIDEMTVTNGYAKNADIFRKNSRVRTLELLYSTGETATVRLSDHMRQQTLSLPKVAEAQWVQVRIVDVYRGSRYTDTAISELRLH